MATREDRTVAEMQEEFDYLKEQEIDAFFYVGPVDKSGYAKLCDALDRPRQKKALLYLCTSGGDPNAGYRIARAFTHHYGAENFRVAVPFDCKSAGTLVCIGAHSLVLFDRGELGPLDIQFQKQDEIFQRSSGLDIIRGMTYLQSEALNSFKQYLFDINGGSGISTRVASEIASNLVKGLFTPVYGQIDPVKLGEMNAALQIAHEYGTRLNEKSKNLKSDSLRKLIHEYPAHGFVIDRAEARKLFERVTPPTPIEASIAGYAQFMWKTRPSKPQVLDVNEFLKELLSLGNSDDPSPSSTAAEKPSDAPSDIGAPNGQPDSGPPGSNGQAKSTRRSQRSNQSPARQTTT